MRFEDIVKLDVSREDIIDAINFAYSHHYIDNLRNRTPIVAFDSNIRGKIGELCITKYLLANGINDCETHIDENPYGCNIDIKVGNLWGEIKTSNIPNSASNLRGVINNCDIKIIKRNNSPAIELDRDFYIQVYFDCLTKERDTFLNQVFRQNNMYISNNPEDVYRLYNCSFYLDNTYFFAWNNKESIAEYLRTLTINQRTYKISYRNFWKCPLSHAQSPISIIDYFCN